MFKLDTICYALPYLSGLLKCLLVKYYQLSIYLSMFRKSIDVMNMMHNVFTVCLVGSLPACIVCAMVWCPATFLSCWYFGCCNKHCRIRIRSGGP